MLNSLDQDQARHSVRPDLDPNCLQTLSADDTSRGRVKLRIDNWHCKIMRLRNSKKCVKTTVCLFTVNL